MSNKAFRKRVNRVVRSFSPFGERLKVVLDQVQVQYRLRKQRDQPVARNSMFQETQRSFPGASCSGMNISGARVGVGSQGVFFKSQKRLRKKVACVEVVRTAWKPAQRRSHSNVSKIKGFRTRRWLYVMTTVVGVTEPFYAGCGPVAPIL